MKSNYVIVSIKFMRKGAAPDAPPPPPPTSGRKPKKKTGLSGFKYSRLKMNYEVIYLLRRTARKTVYFLKPCQETNYYLF